MPKNATAAKLVAMAAQLLEVAATMQETTSVPTGPEWLDEDQLFGEFGLKKDSADARGIPRARVGRKNRWRRADVLASISTKAPKPRAKKLKKSSTDDDPFQRLLDSGEVIQGAR